MYYAVRNSLFFEYHRLRERRVRVLVGVLAKCALLTVLCSAAALGGASTEPLRNVGSYVRASYDGLTGRLGDVGAVA